MMDSSTEIYFTIHSHITSFSIRFFFQQNFLHSHSSSSSKFFFSVYSVVAIFYL
ncbi:hypothetical protein KsCSTR_48600 [Candidatus Kuenenia stuttgartiensis]|uniref:Uncharacterized protein n=1 Tax=Kuenenia stuttgartiensis TaxID=174633 RepID=Q1PVM0_KUEST|nr:hypothetical protein KsCSTR_48600 [Candidatus Kuenenia stuttgartiensis]CAJ71275.1 unknown protein [Candidatus Kuenenia stuttgartiensis]